MYEIRNLCSDCVARNLQFVRGRRAGAADRMERREGDRERAPRTSHVRLRSVADGNGRSIRRSHFMHQKRLREFSKSERTRNKRHKIKIKREFLVHSKHGRRRFAFSPGARRSSASAGRPCSGRGNLAAAKAKAMKSSERRDES